MDTFRSLLSATHDERKWWPTQIGMNRARFFLCSFVCFLLYQPRYLCNHMLIDIDTSMFGSCPRWWIACGERLPMMWAYLDHHEGGYSPNYSVQSETATQSAQVLRSHDVSASGNTRRGLRTNPWARQNFVSSRERLSRWEPKFVCTARNFAF